MTDTARVLVTAAVLSGGAMVWIAWRVRAADSSDPARLIGQLRLAQLGALLLAAIGAMSIGLAQNASDHPLVHLDAAIGVAFVGIAWIVVHRDPREGLLLAVGAFVLHALIDLAHRPGWLSPEIASRGVVLVGGGGAVARPRPCCAAVTVKAAAASASVRKSRLI